MTSMNLSISTIENIDIELLKKESSDSRKKRSRICLHQNHKSKIQQMLINLNYDSWIPIHRQPNQTETFILLEGGLKVVFFEESGKVKNIKNLGLKESKMIHFEADVWHTCLATSDHVLYFELTEGPYDPNNTLWADWMELKSDQEIKDYMDFLRRCIP